MRPGEKLFEEILTDGEGIQPTHHPAIVVAQAERRDFLKLTDRIEILLQRARARDELLTREQIELLVPEYTPDA